MNNRKAATAYYEEFVTDIFGSAEVAKWHRENFLDVLDDTQFEAMMQRLANGEEFISLISPNLNPDTQINIDRSLKVAKKMGVELFQQLRITDQVSGVTFVTPKKYLVCLMPIRRQAQTLEKKISIPDDNRHINEMTGQATGVSKGSSVSFPELQVLYAQGFDQAIVEMIKFRGGDTKAFQAMNKIVNDTGNVSLNQLARMGTEVKATTSLRTYFRAMHLEPTL